MGKTLKSGFILIIFFVCVFDPASCNYSDSDSLVEDCGDSVVIEGPLYCSNNSVVKDISTVVKGCNPSTVSCYSQSGGSYVHVVEVCSTGYICDNGSCVLSETTTTSTTTLTTTTLQETTTTMPDSCTDTDGGRYIDTQGTVSGYQGGNLYNYTDYCADGVTLIEYYCSNNSPYSEEYFCGYYNMLCSDGICYNYNPFTTTTSTTTTIIWPCDLPGDYPTCGEITLEEVVDFINLWAQGQATLSDVINLINAWAS